MNDGKGYEYRVHKLNTMIFGVDWDMGFLNF